MNNGTMNNTQLQYDDIYSNYTVNQTELDNFENDLIQSSVYNNLFVDLSGIIEKMPKSLNVADLNISLIAINTLDKVVVKNIHVRLTKGIQ